MHETLNIISALAVALAASALWIKRYRLAVFATALLIDATANTMIAHPRQAWWILGASAGAALSGAYLAVKRARRQQPDARS